MMFSCPFVVAVSARLPAASLRNCAVRQGFARPPAWSARRSRQPSGYHGSSRRPRLGAHDKHAGSPARHWI